MMLDPEHWRWPPGCDDLDRFASRLPDPGVKAGDVIKGLREKHRCLGARQEHAVLLVVQGVDTSGKNNLLRHLARGLDPAGFRAWAFGPPRGAEQDHDFLWRAWPLLPAPGEMVAFNRSYYEAVLAERLWPVRPPKLEPDWAERHRAINAFERHLVQSGTTIIKCWLHLSGEEHRRRLLARLDDPRKQWKFEESDVRNFRQRNDYLALAGKTLHETHTGWAPWHLIPADDRGRARALVAALVGQKLDALAPSWPACDEELLSQFKSALQDQGGGQS
jgi:polyphosphate kinase 2 (PPK2 family)